MHREAYIGGSGWGILHPEHILQAHHWCKTVSRFILQFLYRCLFHKRCQGGSAGLQYALVYQPSDDILWTEMTDLGLKNSFTQEPSDNC
jgi:hypothetical protein